MSVSIENTSEIPGIVWIIGFLILAAIVLYAISRGHNVKIGPIEFESKKEEKKEEKTEEKKQTSSSEESSEFSLSPDEQKKLSVTAEPLSEGIAHLWGTKRKQDYELAFLYFKKAADAGQSEAIMHLGYMYEKGLYVHIDYQKAMSLYRKAAAMGNATAINNVGFMYENALGVPRDYSAAAAWYIKAADLGNSDAQTSLQTLWPRRV